MCMDSLKSYLAIYQYVRSICLLSDGILTVCGIALCAFRLLSDLERKHGQLSQIGSLVNIRHGLLIFAHIVLHLGRLSVLPQPSFDCLELLPAALDHIPLLALLQPQILHLCLQVDITIKFGLELLLRGYQLFLDLVEATDAGLLADLLQTFEFILQVKCL